MQPLEAPLCTHPYEKRWLHFDWDIRDRVTQTLVTGVIKRMVVDLFIVVVLNNQSCKLDKPFKYD